MELGRKREKERESKRENEEKTVVAGLRSVKKGMGDEDDEEEEGGGGMRE